MAAVVALATFAIVWVGVLPSPHTLGQWIGVRLVEPERYPCEDHACGCASSEGCWHDCCCFTPHQRLAWAIRNGVKPPESVHVTEGQWLAAANDVQPGSATCWTCVDTLLDELSRGIGRRPTCVHGEEAQDNQPDRAGCCDRMPAATISPAGCKGLVSLIVLSLPPARWTGALSWEFDLVDSPALVDEQVLTAPRWRSLEIPTPPPRQSCVAVNDV